MNVDTEDEINKKKNNDTALQFLMVNDGEY